MSVDLVSDSTLYRVTLQFRRQAYAYVAATSFDDAQRILTSPLIQELQRADCVRARVKRIQSLDPQSLSTIALDQPVYTPEGEKLGTVAAWLSQNPYRRDEDHAETIRE